MEALAMVAQAINVAGGENPEIISRKRLTKSDCDSRQNRYLFPDEDVRNLTLDEPHQLINEEEMVIAHLPLGINLNDDPNRRDLGLHVDLYIVTNNNDNLVLENFPTVLKHRLSKGVVLKGRGWKSVVAAGNLAEGDDVIIWGFRRLGNLCLFIQKINEE